MPTIDPVCYIPYNPVWYRPSTRYATYHTTRRATDHRPGMLHTIQPSMLQTINPVCYIPYNPVCYWPSTRYATYHTTQYSTDHTAHCTVPEYRSASESFLLRTHTTHCILQLLKLTVVSKHYCRLNLQPAVLVIIQFDVSVEQRRQRTWRCTAGPRTDQHGVCVQVTQFAKMEKADVMEMTVDHLRNVHTALAARKSLGLLTLPFR